MHSLMQPLMHPLMLDSHALPVAESDRGETPYGLVISGPYDTPQLRLSVRARLRELGAGTVEVRDGTAYWMA